MAPHVVVLGGGITALSTAYHLARLSDDIHITVLEASTRLGGWLDSHRVPVVAHGELVLESGPRTLRPNSKALLELVSLLHLENELVKIPKSSPVARNRFLYLPRTGLTVLPTPASLASFWTSPVGFKLLAAVFKDLCTAQNRPSGSTDESLHSFSSRRFGLDVAQTFVSAFAHGIFAADSTRLSVRAAFPSLWDAEGRGKGSVIWGFMKSKPAPPHEEYALDPEFEQSMTNVSVFSFKRGLGALISALERELNAHDNVDISVGDAVTSVDLDDPSTIRTKSGRVLSATHIISTLPIKRLETVLTASSSVSNTPLTSFLSSYITPSSSVDVINFVFPPTAKPIHPPGYGYLIPRPPDGYQAASENGQGILGVIFDSEALREQDSAKGYTKMTVITGGPYQLSYSEARILDDVRGHLGAKYEVPDPVYTKVTECRDCIPLYEVGHVEWTDELKQKTSQTYGRRLHIIGTGIAGVGVADCVEQGRRTAKEVFELCKV